MLAVAGMDAFSATPAVLGAFNEYDALNPTSAAHIAGGRHDGAEFGFRVVVDFDLVLVERRVRL